ncbi:MAG: hypothetical protein NC043_05985 [Muribaculaceae bacterium]|nr:hypothetical protein [Muribaculaceae bacterium]
MLKESLESAIREFIADDVTFGDNYVVAVDREAGTAVLIDADAAGDALDDDPRDIYPAMDLVRMSETNPGQWEPDPDAMAEVTE